MEKHAQLTNLYIATLRFLYLMHQHCHWVSKGNNFYGLHLLFERLYKSAQDNADLAAEKMIGLFDNNGINYSQQAEFINKLFVKYDLSGGDLAQVALKAEQDFLAFSSQMYDIFEKNDIMTLGLDDAISAIANKREEAVYLLKQTLNNLE